MPKFVWEVSPQLLALKAKVRKAEDVYGDAMGRFYTGPEKGKGAPPDKTAMYEAAMELYLELCRGIQAIPDPPPVLTPEEQFFQSDRENWARERAKRDFIKPEED